MNKYTLTFEEAIRKCLNNEGYIRGENFRPGYYVNNKDNLLVLVDGENLHQQVDLFFVSKGTVDQKYKLFAVANKRELELAQ